jgi:hypothetical protein
MMGVTFSHAFAKVRALILALAVANIAPLPTSAQQDDIAASQKRFDEFYTKGNYPAALLEAQKLETLIKARLGVDAQTTRWCCRTWPMRIGNKVAIVRLKDSTSAL